MARVSRSKPKKQPAKKQVGPSARSPAKKGAKAAPMRQARKGKSAPRGAAKAKAAPAAAKRAARPRRAPRTDEVRQQVARAKPQAAATKLEAAVEHDHQDPRLSGVGGTSPEGEKVQTFNYGQFKNKAVARLDKPVNWFRRAAKPKQ